MRKLLVLASLVSAFNATANTGGDGVIVGDKVQLYELYESGLQNLNLSEEVSKNVHVTTKINKALSSFSPRVRDIVANKMVALRDLDTAFAEVLLHGLSVYYWKIVPFPLQDVADSDGVDITSPLKKLVQIADRKDRTIRIDKNLLSKMDDGQVAALILHETLFTYVTPMRINDYNDRLQYRQNSQLVRDINSYLFSSDFRSNPEAFFYLVDNRLPVSSELDIEQAKYFIFHESGFDTEPSVTLQAYDSSNGDFINYETWSAKNGEIEKILNRVCKGREYVAMNFRSKNVFINFDTFYTFNTLNTYLTANTAHESYSKQLKFELDDYRSKKTDPVKFKECVQGISKNLNSYFQRYTILN